MKQLYLTITCLFLLGIAVSSRAQTVLATFEEANTDFFDAYEWGATDAGAASIENNPSTTGLNNSLKSLKNLRNTGCSWTDNLMLFNAGGQTVTVNEQNRYLHVYVYATEAASGRIHLRSVADDGVWTHEADDRRADFDFAANTWKDIVIDLSSKGFESLNGMFFLSQDWDGAPADRHFYYDEIILNDDATPRAVIINNATTLADFEENGVSLPYSNSGNAFLSLDVDDNPYTNQLNNTGKVLSGVTTTSGGEWWGGLKISLGDKVLSVNNDTRYLHFLIYTDLPAIEFVAGSDWAGSSTITKQDEWFDFVVDLFNVGSKNLEGSQVGVFDLVINTSNANCQGRTFLIDEIIVNGDAAPRVSQTGIKTIEFSEPVEINHYTLQGILVPDIKTNGIYLVKKLYKSGKITTGKVFVKIK
ncbi:MAG: hypothetical protein LBR97_06550 [Dysgonamonadaceae bacterium]|jgi:hypothetical protein|nr:hypothetical protein [Dysgonamonadaceae bacterium]